MAGLLETISIIGVLVSLLAVVVMILIITTLPYRMKSMRGKYAYGVKFRELINSDPDYAFTRLDAVFLWIGLNHQRLWSILRWTAPAVPVTAIALLILPHV